MGCSLLTRRIFILCRETTNLIIRVGWRFGISTLFRNISHCSGWCTMIDSWLTRWGPGDIWLRIALARDAELRWNQWFIFLGTAQNRNKSGAIGGLWNRFVSGTLSLSDSGLKEMLLIMPRPWRSTSLGTLFLQPYAGTCGLVVITLFSGMMTLGSSAIARTFNFI